MPGCLTVVTVSQDAVLTHAEVGHATASQDHDEFGLVCPPLLFSSCIQLLRRGTKAEEEIMEITAVGICQSVVGPPQKYLNHCQLDRYKNLQAYSWSPEDEVYRLWQSLNYFSFSVKLKHKSIYNIPIISFAVFKV